MSDEHGSSAVEGGIMSRHKLNIMTSTTYILTNSNAKLLSRVSRNKSTMR